MRSLKLTWIFPVTCLVLLSSPVLAQRTSNEHGRARAFRNGKLKRSKAFGDLPLTFEENVGQADSRVQFITRGRGYSLFFTGTEAVALLRAPSQTAVTRLQRTKQKLPRNLKQAGKSDVFRMRLLNSNERAKVVGIGRMQGTTNYLIGNDRRKWHAGVHTYTKVQYSQVYPGIDLIYYGKQGQLEYDFVVRPGVDPKAISLGFDGAKTKAIEPGGDLIAELDGGRVRLKKPTIYQTIRGKRTSIDGNYSVNKSQGVTVDVGPYDHTQLLIIDPVLVYSTYLGGSGDNEGIFGLSVDAQGNTYVAGFTDSSDFPIVGDSISPAPSGNIVSFVSKLNPTGTGLIYSTYIGGTGGDWPGGLAVDANGYAYVAGYTGSVDFPVTANNAFQTAMGTGATANSFVTKLDVDGQSLVYSTYLGGGTTDWAIGIAVDTNQNAYVAGFATSGTAPAFPTTANALQTSLGTPNGNGFVARLDTTKSGTNSLLYSTFLGGTITTPDEWDQASAIAVDGNQNVYVSGMVSSLDFPITPQTAFQPTLNKTPDNPNAFSAFLTQIDTNKLGAAGLIYSTYLGGTGNCGGQASHVVLDSFGGVWVVGGEGCADFPTTTGVPNSPSGKAFVAKFDTAKWQSASLVCSTLVGGSGGDWAEVIALDPNGDPYIGGWTRSTDFPVTPGALQSTFGGSGENSFLAALSFDASEIIYASYFGGSWSNWNDYLYGLAID